MKYTHVVLWKEKSRLSGVDVQKQIPIYVSDIPSYRAVFDGKVRLGDVSSYRILSL